jgi:hypothetical protein
LQVYLIGRDHQATETDAADFARRFTAWLTDGANSLLGEVIQT